MPNMQTDAEKVRTLRWQLGLNQKQVSEQTGLQRSDISRIENGRRNGTPAQLKTLAEFYGVPVTSLIEQGVA